MILTVCNTCKREGWDADRDDETDGARLCRLISAAADTHPEITFREHACLMGCNFGCNIALQEEGKLTYTLGLFEPSQDAAEAIVEFAAKYAESETGQVPFREWPQGVKGHFRARIPPIADTSS